MHHGVTVQQCCLIESGELLKQQAMLMKMPLILNKKLLLVVEFEAWNEVWFRGGCLHLPNVVGVGVTDRMTFKLLRNIEC
ncbi:hypothetical protein ACOSQ3_030654 [Xanthoceras sorbifolium]